MELHNIQLVTRYNGVKLKTLQYNTLSLIIDCSNQGQLERSPTTNLAILFLREVAYRKYSK